MEIHNIVALAWIAWAILVTIVDGEDSPVAFWGAVVCANLWFLL